MWKRRFAIAASAAAMVAAAGLTATWHANWHHQPQRTNAAAGSTAVLGDYATPIVGPVGSDGVAHIDDAATINKLLGAHINTYAYLIYPSPLYGTADPGTITQTQWDDLPGFATAAAQAHINVLVYIVPPSESHATTNPTTTPQYQPFGWDYQAWATHIAQVAGKQQNIRGMIVDDFGANTAENNSPYAFRFTPQYVGQMRTAAKAIAPWFTLSTIMYYPDLANATAILANYRNDLDGIVFPYRSQSTGIVNTADAREAESEGRSVGSVLRCHAGNSCLQVHYPAKTASSVGQEGGVSQQIQVEGSAAKRTLSFWVNDDFLTGSTSGFHIIQAVIDGTVVASEDVNGYTTGWHEISADVTDALAGKTSADLTLRVIEQKGVSNFAVSAYFDDVSGTGLKISDPGFEASGIPAWTPQSNATFSSEQVHNLQYLFMTYAQRLGAERTRDPNYQTSADYVGTVVGAALDLTRLHIADGSLIYTLPLAGGDPNSVAEYNAVARLYGDYK
ncbi:MAG: hypothetical protein J2P17_28345 [Mycobacterium sp.]|nr:hypothetical protein [Mycobacterium sp.]